MTLLTICRATSSGVMTGSRLEIMLTSTTSCVMIGRRLQAGWQYRDRGDDLHEWREERLHEVEKWRSSVLISCVPAVFWIVLGSYSRPLMV